MEKMTRGFLGGALYTHTSARHGPENVVLDTGDGGVCNGQCPKILFGFWGGAPNTHISVHHGPENVSLDTWDGGVWNARWKK